MLVSIGSYEICDGTLAGGVAVTNLKLTSDRLFDFVVPVGDVDCVLLDRVNSTTELTFIVSRTHASRTASEQFILQLDNLLPTSGTVRLTTTGPTPGTRVIEDGFLVDHSLVLEQGCTTFHQYHITGGPPVAP